MNLARHASFREDIHKVRASTRSSQASSGSGTYCPGVSSCFYGMSLGCIHYLPVKCAL